MVNLKIDFYANLPCTGPMNCHGMLDFSRKFFLILMTKLTVCDPNHLNGLKGQKLLQSVTNFEYWWTKLESEKCATNFAHVRGTNYKMYFFEFVLPTKYGSGMAKDFKFE